MSLKWRKYFQWQWQICYINLCYTNYTPCKWSMKGIYCFQVVRPWFRLCFRSISWKQLMEFDPNFAYASILTKSRLGLLSGNFHKFVTELWPLTDVRISFWWQNLSWEQIDGIWPNVAYALILTRSRLGLLRVNFCKFITVVWHLILEFCFCSISWEQTDGIRPNFVYALILTRSR